MSEHVTMIKHTIREVREEPRERKEKEKVPPPRRGGWTAFNLCVAEDYVNCTFGENGACLTPRHVRSGNFKRAGKGWALKRAKGRG